MQATLLPEDVKVEGTKSAKASIATYKIILLRNPVSLRTSLSVASLALAVGFLLGSEKTGLMGTLLQLAPASLWSLSFFLSGVVSLISMFRSIPKLLEVGCGIFSLFLWSLVAFCALQTATDVTHFLLVAIVLSNTWVLVHLMMPHTHCYYRNPYSQVPSECFVDSRF